MRPFATGLGMNPGRRASAMLSRASLALTSIMLASVEILSQHEQNAWAHFLGAVQIIMENRLEHGNQRLLDPAISSLLNNALVRINIVIAGYGLSRTPQRMYLKFQEAATSEDEAFHDPKLAIKAARDCRRKQ